MNRKWKKVLTFAFAMSIAVNLAAFDGGRSKEQEKKLTPATKIDSPKEIQASVGTSGEDYVVVMTEQRYVAAQGVPEISGQRRPVASANRA